MLRLSKKMFYAVEAVLHLAYQSSSDPVSSKTIAGRQGLPPRYLEQIMQQLVRAGILRGIRGPKGGYVLAKERRKILIADICSVIETMDALNTAMLAQTPLGKQIVFPLCEQTRSQMHEMLGKLTIADLCKQAEQANVATSSDAPANYTI